MLRHVKMEIKLYLNLNTTLNLNTVLTVKILKNYDFTIRTGFIDIILVPDVVSSLWVTNGYQGRYQHVTLKVAPVGDPRDCHSITLAPN